MEQCHRANERGVPTPPEALEALSPVGMLHAIGEVVEAVPVPNENDVCWSAASEGSSRLHAGFDRVQGVLQYALVALIFHFCMNAAFDHRSLTHSSKSGEHTAGTGRDLGPVPLGPMSGLLWARCGEE